MTTTRLTIPRRRRLSWRDLSTPQLALMSLAALLLVVGAVQLQRAWRTRAPAVVPTPALSYIIVATSVPTAIPPTPAPPPPATPDPRILEELAALRAQVAELQAAQQAPAPAPQIVYVEQPAPPPADDPPAAPAYAVTSVDAAPTMVPPVPTFAPLAPQQAAILDRNAWAAEAAAHR